VVDDDYCDVGMGVPLKYLMYNPDRFKTPGRGDIVNKDSSEKPEKEDAAPKLRTSINDFIPITGWITLIRSSLALTTDRISLRSIPP
jgi:hypothetical protein